MWPSKVAVSKSGSMTNTIFQQYAEQNILDLQPNLGPKFEFTETGRVIRGSVIIKTDLSPGQLVAKEDSTAWREKLRKKGDILLGSLCNATSVNTEMDNHF